MIAAMALLVDGLIDGHFFGGRLNGFPPFFFLCLFSFMPSFFF
jgi:hypothetical protein